MEISRIEKQLSIDNVLDFFSIYEIYVENNELNDEEQDYYVILYKYLEQQKFNKISKYKIEEYLSKYK